MVKPAKKPELTRETKKRLQSLVDRGLLSERAMRRYLMSRDELLALLDDSDQQAEVVDDLNAALNAVAREGARKRRH